MACGRIASKLKHVERDLIAKTCRHLRKCSFGDGGRSGIHGILFVFSKFRFGDFLWASNFLVRGFLVLEMRGAGTFLELILVSWMSVELGK